MKHVHRIMIRVNLLWNGTHADGKKTVIFHAARTEISISPMIGKWSIHTFTHSINCPERKQTTIGCGYNVIKYTSWCIHCCNNCSRIWITVWTHKTHSISHPNAQVIGYSCEDHYSAIILGTMASQITSLTIIYSTFYSGTDQRKHQSSTSLAFVREFTGDRWIPRTNGQ